MEKIENEEEAKRKLLEMLVKVSFVEASLTMDGRQNVEELWENLRKSVTEEQEFPFTSMEDLSTFLHSMIPIFRKDVRTKKWAKTGCPFRRFCQWLYDRLSLGDVIDEKNFDQE
ncbi:hypothetical protein CAEBREN_01015 [Caenorhabditis brenneri]|uniref:Uncharacterized protein n=1 Tax=Caenorhabditis brenneri TaxID=135651 RepID=G0N2X9_CAEBE|nr:hypothetical protein CAEBREN_01015 [Caenorhabditis brenneri]